MTTTTRFPPFVDAADPAPPHVLTPVLDLDPAGGYRLDIDVARAAGAAHAARYRTADPYPHIVLDDFLPRAAAALAAARFPDAPLPSDHVFEAGYAGLHKRQISPWECDAEVRALFAALSSPPMLAFLEGLTGIEGLMPDPYFLGGGFHETARGGKLGIHADFRLHERLNLQRRVNLILYLNRDWRPQWGGGLEIWSRDMKRRCQTVQPVFDRAAIFSTDASSFHGHPDPLATPRRRGAALDRALLLHRLGAHPRRGAGPFDGLPRASGRRRADAARSGAPVVLRAAAPVAPAGAAARLGRTSAADRGVSG
jgi:hypothetical protein